MNWRGWNGNEVNKILKYQILKNNFKIGSITAI